MESPPRECDKVFKEHEDKCSNITRSFFGSALIEKRLKCFWADRKIIMTTYHIFPKIRIGKSSANRLVYEEDVCNFVPRIRIERGLVCACDATWSLLTMMAKIVHIECRSVSTGVPTSIKSPIDELHPGPPFVQNITSSVFGSCLLSKK
jgi:hypothetical protein